MKMRKRVTLAQLQTELIELLKNMFLPSKKLVKETIEWLIENKYMERDEANINTFIYTTWERELYFFFFVSLFLYSTTKSIAILSVLIK